MTNPNRFIRSGFLILLALSSFTLTNAQTSNDSSFWKKGGFAALNFNQVQLVNWAAGGQSSYAAAALFSGFSDFHSNKIAWENNIDMAIGAIRSEESKVQKNEDRLELNSKFGRKLTGQLFLTTLMNFRTQFANGYNYPNDSVITSRFMAPAYLTIAQGVDWKPVDYFSVFVSPATGKFTFVNDDDLAARGAYGVDPGGVDSMGNIYLDGKKIRAEFGASLMVTFKKDLNKQVNLQSRLLLFNNYTDKNKQHRDNIDVNLDFQLAMKLGKYFGAILALNLIYDHDIDLPIYQTINGVKTETKKGPRTQIKETFGLGFSYKFGKERG